MEKKKVVIDLAKLTPDLMEVFSETFPEGIAGKTVRFPNSRGEIVSAVRMETDDTIYLVKVMSKLKEVLTEDELDEMVKSSGKEDLGEGEEEEEADESGIAEDQPDED